MGVDHREFCEGGFPAGDGLVFDEFAGCGARLARGTASLFGVFAGSLVLDVHDR